MKKTKILVPTDFTKVAECAIHHGTRIAKTTGDEVALLHVVDSQDEVDEAKTKVDQLAQQVSDQQGVPTTGIVRIGNIFEDIGDAASEIGARLIVMGTHGMKGIQHLTGSYALRVITHSTVPFIVVQEKDPSEGYGHIVLPLDLSKETKQKLSAAVEIAEYFNSRIHIIVPNETDEFLVNQLKRNIAYAKNYLKEHNIRSDTSVTQGDESNFAKEVIKFAADTSADLITIMNLQENSLMGILGTSYEQQMITNDAQIPIMCVNPKAVSVGGGAGLFS